jgi:hypothetical protein
MGRARTPSRASRGPRADQQRNCSRASPAVGRLRTTPSAFVAKAPRSAKGRQGFLGGGARQRGGMTRCRSHWPQLWRLQGSYFPKAAPCIDWYSIVEKLREAGGCLHSEGSEDLAAWVAEQQRRLRRSDLGVLAAELSRAYNRHPRDRAEQQGTLEATARHHEALRRTPLPHALCLAQPRGPRGRGRSRDARGRPAAVRPHLGTRRSSALGPFRAPFPRSPGTSPGRSNVLLAGRLSRATNWSQHKTAQCSGVFP